MNLSKEIELVFNALNAVTNLDGSLITNNETLQKEIKSALSPERLNSLVNNLTQAMQDQALNSQQDQTAAASSEDLFTRNYVNYQNQLCKLHDAKASNRFTRPASSRQEAIFNSKPQEITLDDEATELRKVMIEGTKNSLYGNKSLQINTENDPTMLGSFIDYSPYTQNYYDYLSIPILDVLIDKPINIAFKFEPEIDFENDDLDEDFKKVFKRSNLLFALRDMVFNSALSPRGALLVPIYYHHNGRVKFTALNDTQFTYAAIQPRSFDDLYIVQNGTRILISVYALGGKFQNEVTAWFSCPGFEPIYGIGKNKTRQLREAAQILNIYVYIMKVLAIRAQIITQKWNGAGENDAMLTAMKRLQNKINSSLSLSEVVPVTDDSNLEILNNNFSPGYADAAPVIKSYIGAISGVMPDFLFGSDTAYAANSFNLNVTSQNIHSEIQKQQIEPALRFAIDFLLRYDKALVKYKNEVDNYTINFPSLYERTENEKLMDQSIELDNFLKMADYPEYEEYYKKLDLLDKDITLNKKKEGSDDDNRNIK